MSQSAEEFRLGVYGGSFDPIHLGHLRSELEREDTSYSIDTLQSVQADYPHADLTLIIGMDQFSAFDTWHRWQELLQSVELVVMERPGETMSDSARDMIDSPLQQRISVVRVTQMDISSSRIRQDLQAGLDIRFLVPYAVRNYIRTENLYLNSVE